MKKFNSILLLVILFVFSSFFTIAQNNYQVTRNDYQKIKISLTTSELQSVTVKTDAGYFSHLEMADFHNSTIVGQPELPKMVKLVEIPICENVNINVIPGEYTIYSAEDLGITYPVMPAQPSYTKSHEGPVTLVQNHTTYSTDAFYGEELVTVTKQGIARSVNFAELTFSPIQYNPVTHQFKIYESAEVEITFVNANIAETQRLKRLHSNSMFSTTQLGVINPSEESIRGEFSTSPIRMVIVAHSMFRGQLDELAAWKRRKGFLVDLVYTDDPNVGTTTTSIKNYLKGLYDNATESAPAPTFLLLVGDVAQIPAFNGTTDNHVTDLYYASWTTGDNIPDCYYGRFSATNASQLAPQIEKTLMYEQYTMDDPTYLDDAVLVAGTDSYWGPINANGQINYLAGNYVNTAYGFSTIHTHLYNCSSQAATIRAEIGAGVGYANYTAHCSPSGWGDPSFTTSHVPNMSNTDKYGLMIGNCCQSNAFDENACFGEALLRADKKGAVAYIGASNNSLWNEDYYWSVGYRSNPSANPTYNANNLGAYDRLFHTHNEAHDLWLVTNGGIVTAGNLAVQSSNSSYKLYYWEIYHIMGDPSIMPYLSEPSTLTATFPSAITVGTNNLSVQTEPHAYVALTFDGQLIGAAFADGNGNATLTFDPLATPGIYEVAVWAQNHIQYFGEINVIVPTGSFVIAEQVTTTPSTISNNSRIGIDCALKNVGVDNATDVYATISSQSPNITILQDSIYVGNISQGASIPLNMPFIAQVSDNITDGTAATLTIFVHSNNNEATKEIPLTLAAPKLELEGYTISNANGSNTYGAGDTLNIAITHKNNGHAGIGDLFSSLASFNSDVKVKEALKFVGFISASGTNTTTFQVVLDSELPENPTFELTHTLFKGSFVCESSIFIALGSSMEDFETGDFTAFEWTNNNSPWIITTTTPYAGSYAAKSANNLANYGKSTLMISMNALASGNISYKRKVSSESGYDFFKFYIDGVEKESLSGTAAWSTSSFPVEAGEHIYKFEYSKDVSTANGSDCAWIDNISFPPFGNATEPDIPQLRVTGHLVNNENPEDAGTLMFNEEITLTFTIENDDIAEVSNIFANLTTNLSSNPDYNQATITGPLTIASIATNSTTTHTFNLKVTPDRTTPFSDIACNFSLAYDSTIIVYPFTLQFENHAAPGEVGICDNENTFNFSVTPNPTTEQIQIISEEDVETYEISDLNGKLVSNGILNDNRSTINVNRLAAGIYIIKVTTTSGKTAAQKIVKQ